MIIITGGAGFIGSNLVAGLEAKGLNNLVIVDRFGSDDKWRNVAKRELRDVVPPEDLFSYLDEHKSEVEAIFHIGAISSTTEWDADLIIDNNFTLSRKLWKWCGTNKARFIYASSAATYGSGDHGFQDDCAPEALAKLRPLNPYGWSKHLFDRRVIRVTNDKKEAAVETVPPQWAGLKFFNVYGPNEYHKEEQMSVIRKLYPQVIAGAAAKLFKSNNSEYEDGGQIRDFIYVQDCVDVMLWLYDHPEVNGLFNVGTGKGRSFNDLAGAVFKAVGKPAKISYIDMPQAISGKYQYYTQADVTRLRAHGYTKPFTELEEGVRLYVQDFLSQDDPYR